MRRRVTIGPAFFKKAFNDYSDWHWALVREAMQNCIDAPRSTRITVTVEKREDGNTVFTFSNNGKPMSESELTDKLLALGESGKDWEGTVGGFGKAKEILYFAHLGYELRTGTLRAKGSGGDYELETRDPYPGTMSRVVIEGDCEYELLNAMKRFIRLSQWKGMYSLNGVEHRSNLHKGARCRDFDWGTVYTNKTFSNMLIVRINGMVMFSRYLTCKGRCVLVELKDGTSKTLQSNRDGLKWEPNRELTALVDEITVNKHSALGSEPPEYTHYAGTRLKAHKGRESEPAKEGSEKAPAGNPLAAVLMTAASTGRKTETAKERKTETANSCGFDFVVKNTLSWSIPDWYVPGSRFSGYSLKLASIWAKCLLTVHELLGVTEPFSIGFLFGESLLAEVEKSNEYGLVYYLSPAKLSAHSGTARRCFKNRYNFNRAGRMTILSLAVHEVVHTLGYRYHDEDYASQLTDVMATVMANISKFNSCFK